MITRRNFIQTGTLVFAGIGTARLGFSFVPGGRFDEGPFRNAIAFRKPVRAIREEVGGFLWADAADFNDYGGWALDTQFVGFMGSSCLIAHGAGAPVEDARLEIPGVRAGRYRLWVRSHDWIPEHSPGMFSMSVNGRTTGKEFGAQGKPGWLWEDGGVHELPAGAVTVSLKDLTGYYGRCSSVILTRDLKYTPPADLDAFRKERARLSGVSDEPVRRGEFDVVVVGAGTAGCCAAIAAARMGAKTVLISDRPVVGGNSSVELGVPVCGAAQRHKDARETGIIEEVGRLLHAREKQGFMTRAFADVIAGESNLTLVENVFVEGVEKDGDSCIRAAIARDTLTGARSIMSGRMFVDASGDAWLGHHAGAEFRLGRESRDEFNENLAPETSDAVTMSACLRAPREDFRGCIFYRTVQEATPQPYVAPSWVPDLPPFAEWQMSRGAPDKLLSSARSGTWWLEHHGIVDDLNDPEGARDELIRVNLAFWNQMKNHWPEKARIAKYRLDYVPFSVAKRETRRLIGDVVLTSNDCITARHFEDVIGHSGWTLDVHAVDGIFSTTGPFDCNEKIPVCEIPYRCLYSRNVDNLLMAGRNISVTHYALGTVRVQGQTSLTGQAAGTAAALAVRRGTTPRGLYERHLRELQQTLLKHDQFLPRIRNEDSGDLARRAKVRASSAQEAVSEAIASEKLDKGRWLELTTGRGVIFPWPGGRLEQIRIPIETKQAAEITLRIRSAKSGDDVSSVQDLAKVTHRVAVKAKDWVTFPVGVDVPGPYAWVFAAPAGGASWMEAGSMREGFARFYGREGDWRMVKESAMALDFDPDPLGPPPTGYEPANVINGIARPWPGQSNVWRSSAAEKLPQWIELALEQPSRVSAVHCVFDTDLSIMMGKQSDTCPQGCVRDYRIEIRIDGAWQTVVREQMNFQRFRRHVFTPAVADAVCLTVEAVERSTQACVHEIRVYSEAQPFASA